MVFHVINVILASIYETNLLIEDFFRILEITKRTKTSHHGPDIVGYRRATILLNKEMQKREFELISKNRIEIEGL